MPVNSGNWRAQWVGQEPRAPETSIHQVRTAPDLRTAVGHPSLDRRQVGGCVPHLAGRAWRAQGAKARF